MDYAKKLDTSPTPDLSMQDRRFHRHHPDGVIFYQCRPTAFPINPNQKVGCLLVAGCWGVIKYQ